MAKNQIKKFISFWMKGYEHGTFVQNEQGIIMSSSGNSSLNLTVLFEDLLSNYSDELKTAVADYMYSEGCDCCRADNHDEHAEVLAKLLNIKKHKDGSGYDFSSYRTRNDKN